MNDITAVEFAILFLASGCFLGTIFIGVPLGALIYHAIRIVNQKSESPNDTSRTLQKEECEMNTFTTEIEEPKYGIGWKREDLEGGGQIMANERMKVSVEYGATKDPSGVQLWDQPRIVNPGGAVLVTFTINKDGIVFLGLDKGLRHVAQRAFLQFIRGFADPKEIGYESPLDTATREWKEESLQPLDPSRLVLLLDGVNVDTAWFFHPMVSDDQVGGVSFYALEIPFEELAVNASGELTFKESIKFPEKGKGRELAKLAFYPPAILDMTPAKCGLTKMGTLLLMEHLRTTGVI